ncbi:MAG TPA: DUF3592 domain-containing protein [Sphingopyxis sp.]|nr:DUF3592 domain-containing protein [Sphingopyxis sp.]HMP46640.1 DUF3592 domain-containing protein [Sphingopyxis sp.]HMQ18664.1 DUF3592 domain-containing protein [Sphingopyxis sp.]
MEDDWMFRAMPWFFAGMGLLFAGIGLWMAKKELRGRRWNEVEGVIVDHNSHWDRDSDGHRTQMHTAVIEYRLPGMGLRRIDDSMATNSRRAVGSRMRVRYNPDNPHEAIVWAPLRMGCFLGLFTGIGSLFAAIGIAWIALGWGG